MLLSQKLKIFLMLTFVGIVFMTVSFVSPGWVNCKWSNRKSLMNYFIIKGYPNNMSPELMNDLDLPGYPKTAHLSAGLWYFTVCIKRMFNWTSSMEEEECHLSTYPFHIELAISNRIINPAYFKVRGLPKNFMLEIQIIPSIGLFCAVLGFIGAIVYTRSLTKSRYAGIMASINLSISGVAYIAAIVRAAIATHANKEKVWDYTGWNVDQLYFPWGLVLGGVGGLLILVSAVGHSCILSRYKTSDDIHVYHIHKGSNQEVVSQHPYTTEAPTGYHATVE